jgi:branched-chain amino acid transport system permease protein
VRALRDASFAAVVAGLLSVPMLSYRSIDAPTGMTLESRWPLALTAIAVVFAGRLLINLAWWDAPAARDAVSNVSSRIGKPVLDLSRWFGLGLLGLAIAMPMLPFAQRYHVDLGILILTYVMLGWGLNIVVGLAGLLDLGYVAFYAVGAYSYALLSTTYGWSFWICLPLAGLLAAFWGILLGFPVLRLRGDYLAIVTVAFGEIIRIVIVNWQSLTNGPNGITNIPRPSFFGLQFKDGGADSFSEFFGIPYQPIHRIIWLYYIILVLALLTNFVTIRLRRLPIGRAWEALREDEIACRALGINTTTTKLTAFAMGAMFGGFAGSFFATKQGFISPESFTFIESAIILAIVVLGGMGSQIGIAVSAIVMTGGIELFRELEQYRMLMFGLAMMLVMIWRPRGLVGSRTPTIALGTAQVIPSDLVKEGHG